MSKRLIIIFIIVIAVIIFSWIFLFTENKPPTNLETSLSTESNTVFKPQIAENKPIYTVLSFPKKQEKEKIQNYIEVEVSSFTKKIEDFKENTENQILNTNEKLSEAQIEKKVFDRLYPYYFIDGLVFTQDVFEEQSFVDTDYKEIKIFDSEVKIFAFVNTIIDVFEEQSFYTQEEANKYRVGVNKTLKDLLESEKILFRNELISSELSKKIFANIMYNARKKASQKIISFMDKIKDITIKDARAADCFRSGGGSGAGANVSAPCCNCGLKVIRGGGTQYVQDCGSGSSGCDIPLGCKNLYGMGRAVIWDSSTGICGVG